MESLRWFCCRLCFSGFFNVFVKEFGSLGFVCVLKSVLGSGSEFWLFFFVLKCLLGFVSFYFGIIFLSVDRRFLFSGFSV